MSVVVREAAHDQRAEALEIGDPRMIRRAAISRHKNDFRDAETILDLLMRGQFPSIVPRCEESREAFRPPALPAVFGEKAHIDRQSAAGFRAEQRTRKVQHVRGESP